MSCRGWLRHVVIGILFLFPAASVFAASSIIPLSVSTASPIMGEAFIVTATMSGVAAGTPYFIKCRLGSGSTALSEGQTYNAQTDRWLDDTGANGAWIDMPQITILSDGAWSGDMKCRIKSSAADESKLLYLSACLNADSSCGSSFKSTAFLTLQPRVPTPTITPSASPTAVNTITPTNSPGPTTTRTPTAAPSPTPSSVLTPKARSLSPTRDASFAILGSTSSVSANADSEEVPQTESYKREMPVGVFAFLFVGVGLGLLSFAISLQKIPIWKKLMGKEQQ